MFIVALFGIVVLHELGSVGRPSLRHPHRDITLLPIGGVARLERMPEDPWQELVVALAGPAVNVVMAAGFMSDWARAWTEPVDERPRRRQYPATALLGERVAGGIQRVPAFPMDGGRVLRACWRCDLITCGRPRWPPDRPGDRGAVRIPGLVLQPVPGLHRAVRLAGAAQEASRCRCGRTGRHSGRAMITDFQPCSRTTPWPGRE